MADPHPRTERMAVLALGLAALALGAARLRFAATEPLWFDESFTLALVSRPDWTSFWREAWLDCNAPAYYLLTRLWTGLFGVSDLALRIPSLLAIWVAAALPLVLPVQGLTRPARLTWAALIFAWWGVGYFLDARCYAVLLALATAQTLTFARLLERPTLARALAWTVLAALAIVLHYYALFFGLAQGLIYLARHRLAAVRTWPAALAFVPAFAWTAWHAPRLAEYSRLGGLWHPPTDAQRTFEVAAFLFGPTSPLILAGVALILAAGRLLGRPAAARPPSPLTLTAGAAVLAFAFILVFGLLGSGLSPRYLIPVVPSLLLGVVLIAGTGARPALTYAALALLYFGVQVGPALAVLSPPAAPPRYEHETASAVLMARGVTDVVFVWDYELAPMMDPVTLARVGGVFFNRAHRPVRIHPLVVAPDRDPHPAIAAAATGPRPGVIWLYNRQGRTAAHAFPPAIPKADPAWTCADLAQAPVGGLACWRSRP